MKKIELKKIRRILVIRPRAIGDVILTTPFLRALRKSMPGAIIDFMAEPFTAPVLEGNPHINEIIIFERQRNPKKERPAVKLLRKNELKKVNPFARMIGQFCFYMNIRKKKYDLVFDLWGNVRTAGIALFSGAGYRVGFDFRVRKYFYNVVVKRDSVPKYNAWFQMDLLKAAGIPDDGEQTEFFTSERDERFAEDFFKEAGISGRVIGLNGLGSWAAKRWPAAGFAAVADLFAEKIAGARLLIVWGPGERALAEEVLSLMKNGADKAVILPETGLKQLAAIIKRMDILVTNDGAPKHIAVAVGTPTVTVFGPTNPAAWGPEGNPRHRAVFAGVACSPCDRMECPLEKTLCMEMITPGQVFEAAEGILKKQEEGKNGRD